MTKILNSQITRPHPTAVWGFEWQTNPRAQGSIHRQITEVHASHAADTPEERRGGHPGVAAQFDGDPAETDATPGDVVPNNITVIHRLSSNGQGTTIRLTRSAAEQLIDALTAALGWDGR